jgi:protein-disulfide isomerase
LPRTYFLTGLLALGMAVGCKAQTAPQQPADPSLDRRIEVLVRSKFSVPQDVDLAIGARKPSQFPGYDALPVTLSHGASSKVINFLISTDSATLVRLETFDLARDPIFSIDIAGRPIRGNPAAKVTVVNFDDLQCPFCSRMHQTLFPATLDRYKDLVRFVYKDDPLSEIHPWAMHAAVDANCLAAQSPDVYWAYVDYLHSHGQEISGPDRNLAKSFDALNRIAREEASLAKLDAGKLDGCLAAQDESKVRASAKEAEALGVDGTPALFVEGEKMNGAQPEAEVWKVIDRALRAAGIAPPPLPVPPAPSSSATQPPGKGK